MWGKESVPVISFIAAIFLHFVEFRELSLVKKIISISPTPLPFPFNSQCHMILSRLDCWHIVILSHVFLCLTFVMLSVPPPYTFVVQSKKLVKGQS